MTRDFVYADKPFWESVYNLQKTLDRLREINLVAQKYALIWGGSFDQLWWASMTTAQQRRYCKRLVREKIYQQRTRSWRAQ
jgi:hypothetical protein